MEWKVEWRDDAAAADTLSDNETEPQLLPPERLAVLLRRESLSQRRDLFRSNSALDDSLMRMQSCNLSDMDFASRNSSLAEVSTDCCTDNEESRAPKISELLAAPISPPHAARTSVLANNRGRSTPRLTVQTDQPEKIKPSLSPMHELISSERDAADFRALRTATGSSRFSPSHATAVSTLSAQERREIALKAKKGRSKSLFNVQKLLNTPPAPQPSESRSQRSPKKILSVTKQRLSLGTKENGKDESKESKRMETVVSGTQFSHHEFIEHTPTDGSSRVLGESESNRTHRRKMSLPWL
eukprot:TRINITY_DN17277_c0_g1::TRINITY_DN17277_c0_g1_i1::g.7719::m.7719 TRINITY_DN17277_c0_g1::TRINITY_DN17277_c0_g1_i1::g.7719  ORF type:complete len:307 (+),score=-10.34 TRINITY_DN17277_c0_g1_i1:26-922(+)